AGDFTQWTAAAIVPLGHGAGTMHRGGDQLIRELRVAADRQRLYLRIDGPDLVERLRRGELSLAILADGPDRLVVPLPMSSGSAGDSEGAHSVAEEIVTAAVPFAALQAQAGDRLRLSILVLDGSGHVVEQQPEPAFEIAAPTRHHDA